MADELEQTQQAETQVTETATEPTLQQQIAEQMEFRLNGGEPPTEAAETTETTETTTQTEVPEFKFQTFAEKYGWQTPEDAAKEIEELRLSKANQATVEPKFENDKSKQLFEAIQAGKSDEVYEILAQQKKLDSLTSSEITKDNADAIVKLGMQLKYKDLTQSEIDYKFKKQFGLPKEPILDVDDDDSVAEHNEWKERVSEIEMEKIIEAKLAKPELELAKSKLVLPNIASTVDEDYIQYQKDLEDREKLNVEAKEAYKAFVPKAVEAKMNFNDEANKIQFEFQYEPTPEDFAKTVEVVVDQEKFWNRYKNSDGTPNRQLFLQDVHFILNKEKVMMEAMKQSKNATLKSQLADNSQGGFQRQIPQTQEPNELHKQMMAAGVVK